MIQMLSRVTMLSLFMCLTFTAVWAEDDRIKLPGDKVKITLGGSFYPLQFNEPVYRDGLRYRWSAIPKSIVGMFVLRNKTHQGKISFQVEQTGTIMMAVTERLSRVGLGHVWTSQKELESEGWREIEGLISIDKNKNDAQMKWILFTRHCNKGESFSYQIETHSAPVLILK